MNNDNLQKLKLLAARLIFSMSFDTLPVSTSLRALSFGVTLCGIETVDANLQFVTTKRPCFLHLQYIMQFGIIPDVNGSHIFDPRE